MGRGIRPPEGQAPGHCAMGSALGAALQRWRQALRCRVVPSSDAQATVFLPCDVPGFATIIAYSSSTTGCVRAPDEAALFKVTEDTTCEPIHEQLRIERAVQRQQRSETDR
jgi:hypothetical protein